MSKRVGLPGGVPFTVTFKEKWWRNFRRTWPLVTSCCASLNWVNAITEDGRRTLDICLDCRQETKVDFITLDQYNKKYSSHPLTQEHFDSLWDKPQQSQ